MDEDLQTLIDELLFFIDLNLDFDGKLIDDIITQYEQTDKISEKQIVVLKSIHKKQNVSEFVQMKRFGKFADD